MDQADVLLCRRCQYSLGATESTRFGVQVFDLFEMRHAGARMLVVPILRVGCFSVAGTLRVGGGCPVVHVHVQFWATVD